MIRRVLIAALFAAAAAFTPQLASASHFRGGAMVAQVSSTGMLTVTTTTFWRKTFVGVGEDRPTVAGLGLMTQVGASVIDQTDSRYAILTSVWQRQLNPGAQTANISASSCCRVASGGLANWSASTWTLNSAIVWDGANAANPIAFNFAAVQSQVNRNSSYSDNLNASSPDALTLSYNQALNQNINFQIPTFTVNTTTGALFIAAGLPGTQSITDNPTNPGADAAFSGNIIASNGSFVEFDWMFDGVDQAVTNLAPDVSNTTVFGAPGTVFHYVFTITDPDGDSPLTFISGFFGSEPAPGATFNSATGAFSWDSTGAAPGTYVWQVRGQDPGGLTDTGTITIHLVAQQGEVPEPASFLVMVGIACLVGGTSIARRRLLQS